MSKVKGSVLKFAFGVFFSTLAISVCWNLISQTWESGFVTVGFAAAVAAIVYLVKRGDVFD